MSSGVISVSLCVILFPSSLRGNAWKRLPGNVCYTVNVFKNKIDNYFKRSGAGFMNRRRLCQLTAAILTSNLTTHNYVGFMKRHRLSCNYTALS